MSIRYSIAKSALRVLGFKKMFQLPLNRLIIKAEHLNKNRNFQIPKNRKYIYNDIPIMNGKYHCLSIQKPQQRTEKAILFFFGGGMIIGPDGGDVKCAGEYGADCNMDVWFPYYPLCTRNSILETYKMVFDTYRKMVAVYGAENITLLGFSSGAALAIGVCLYNNTLDHPLPMPHRIVACSPGCCPDSNVQLNKMKELNAKDIMVDVAFMENVRTLMQHGESVPDYMLSGTLGNFKGLPDIHFWYGSDEVLYACAENFVKACKAENVTYTLNVGKGMCHCYPMVSFFPEGKSAHKEICQKICENKNIKL